MSQGRPYGVVCETTREEPAQIIPGTLDGLFAAMELAKALSVPGAVWAVRTDGRVIRRYQGGMEIRIAVRRASS